MNATRRALLLSDLIHILGQPTLFQVDGEWDACWPNVILLKDRVVIQDDLHPDSPDRDKSHLYRVIGYCVLNKIRFEIT